MVADQAKFQVEIGQMRKLVDDIEATKAVKITNNFAVKKLMRNQPFFLLQAVQLDKATTDLVLENLQKVIDTILVEIADLCNQLGLEISSVPDIQALRDITLYVQYCLEDSLGGANSFLLQKCPHLFIQYLMQSLSSF